MEEQVGGSQRRRFIRKLLGVTALGAAAGLLKESISIPKAEAANGDPVIIGQENSGTAITTLSSTSMATATFKGVNSSSSASSVGLAGYATASSGATRGVYGESASTGGMGVCGTATAASGASNGVYGTSVSTTGTGVRGITSATSGASNGVYGRSASTTGTGVCGIATAASGATGGVHGESASTGGMGVRGIATAASGIPVGVFGSSRCTDGIGVRGFALASSGVNYGVHGQSWSPSGVGVYAVNSAGGRALACEGHALPYRDNAYECGNSARRWKLVRGVTITPGDLVFENSFTVTEDEKVGLAFKNDAGEKIAVLDRKGNFHIKGDIIKDL